MSMDRERPLAERIEAAATVAELIDVVESAGGIRRSDGEMQDLKEVREVFTIGIDLSIDSIKRMEKMAPSLFSLVTGTDGFRKRLMILYLRELAAKKKELGG